MKKGLLKKASSLLMAACVVIGTTAVGGKVQAQAATFDPLGKYDKTVKITQTRILASWMGFDKGENEDNNWWTRTYKEQLNIELTNLFTAPNWGPDFDTKINLAIATNNLPDVMCLYSTLGVKAIQGGKVMDLTKAYSSYASPQVKNLYAQDPLALKAWAVNGKLYGLPQVAVLPDWGYIWTPQSYVNTLNGGVTPASFAEIESLAAKIKTKTGSYAIGMNKDLDTLEHLTTMYGGSYQWYDKGGQLVFGKLQPEAKAAWAKAADWYAKGYLAKDFANKSTDDVDADFANNKFGMYFGGGNLPNGASGRNWFKLHNTDDLAVTPIMSPTGKQLTKIVSSDYAGGAIFINKNCKNPDAVFKLINLSTAITNEVGKPSFVKDGTFDWTPNGNMNFWNRLCTGAGYVSDSIPEHNAGYLARQAYANNDRDSLVKNNYQNAVAFYDQIDNWTKKGTSDPNYDLNWSIWKINLGGSVANNIQMQSQGRFIATPKWGMETKEEAKINQNMYAKYIEYATRAIMENNVDKYFDEWVAYYKKNGGDAAVKAVNEWYKTNK